MTVMELVRMSIGTLDIFLLMQDRSNINTQSRGIGNRCFKMSVWPLFLLLSLFHHILCLSGSMCCDGWSGRTYLRPCYGSSWKLLLALMTSLTSTEITSSATPIWHISLISPWSSHKYSLHILFTQKDWRFDWLPSPWPPLRNPAKITLKKKTTSLSSTLIYSNNWCYREHSCIPKHFSHPFP